MIKKIRTKDGLDIAYYYSKGKNRNKNNYMLFIHAWPYNYTSLKNEINFFRKRGYSIIAPDLRGSGHSSKPFNKKAYTFRKYASDINEVIKKEKPKKLILLGHCSGGMITLEYIKEFYSSASKILNGLVLMDVNYRNPISHMNIHFISVIAPLIKILAKFFLLLARDRSHGKKYIDFSKLKHHSAIYLWFNGVIIGTPLQVSAALILELYKYNYKSILGKIKAPALIITGKNDVIVPIKDEEKIAKILKTGRIEVVKGAHDVPIQKPVLVEHKINNFLKHIRF